MRAPLGASPAESPELASAADTAGSSDKRSRRAESDELPAPIATSGAGGSHRAKRRGNQVLQRRWMWRCVIALAPFAVALPAQSLPANWAGAGLALNQSSKPPVAGWAAYAWRISEKGQLYWISTHDVFLSQQKPHIVQVSARTGLATVLRTFGPVVVLGMGDIGVAAGGTALGGAFSGGGLGVLRIGKTNWTIALGARVIKTATGGGQNVYELGTGRTF